MKTVLGWSKISKDRWSIEIIYGENTEEWRRDFTSPHTGVWRKHSTFP